MIGEATDFPSCRTKHYVSHGVTLSICLDHCKTDLGG